MKKLSLSPQAGFEVLASTQRSQVASMVLSPGSQTGGPTNQHPESDQWLYVISGHGTATVNGQHIELNTGDLILIEAGESHQITAGDESPLKTFSIYAPTVY
jgi:mannose-6-phosphate isomerase-like protein (cupin superfamily)